MFRIESEKDLIESFRQLDRQELELPDGIAYPLDVKDYYSWTDSSGHRAFVLFKGNDRRHPVGIAFRQGSGPAAPASMCEWCHAVRAGDAITLMTATASANRRVGVHLCRGITCREKIEAAPGADDIPRSGDERGRVHQVIRRMGDFARRHLV